MTNLGEQLQTLRELRESIEAEAAERLTKIASERAELIEMLEALDREGRGIHAEFPNLSPKPNSTIERLEEHERECNPKYELISLLKKRPGEWITASNLQRMAGLLKNERANWFLAPLVKSGQVQHVGHAQGSKYRWVL